MGFIPLAVLTLLLGIRLDDKRRRSELEGLYWKQQPEMLSVLSFNFIVFVPLQCLTMNDGAIF